ncbi:MAG: isocitrate/isopropylmalate family dehydrogenase [Acidobacteria bacterium]|nr:isocitrate/isopropylmalate family dehydrogenase [Acidobacteriota bacterium]
MAHRITLIPGDGIGPEVTAAVVHVLDRAGVDIEWEPEEAGAAVAQREGKPLPRRVLDSITRNRVALKGPIGTPVGSGFQSVNVEVRRSLDLYANLRPVLSLPGIESRYDGVDLIVVRENTEDLYSGLEHQVVPGVVESLKIITSKASKRIARFAFSYATRHRRRKVTAVHKANIMKLGDGLFLDSVRAVAGDFPAIEYDERIVDAACMHLVIDPGRFDVLLLPNLYGDIVSDLCAGLVGGLGLVPSANLGDDMAVFEAVHGTAPDIAGRQLANPTALLLSALLMLRYLDEDEQAARILAALEQVLASGEARTPDLGGDATTQEFADAISRQVEATAPR